jgi:antitoxin FitA
MAQFVVRNLEETVKGQLVRRAKRHGRSMEEEIREILRDAVKGSARSPVKLGTRIASRFQEVGLTNELEEWRGHHARPMGL